MKAEVNASCRSIPGFVDGVVPRALVSMVTGRSSMNTAYWEELESTDLEEEAGESLPAY